MGEEGSSEMCIRDRFIHVQPHGNPDFSAFSRHRLIGEQLIQLVGVHVQLAAAAGALGNGLLTAVATDKTPVAAEYVNGQAAVVIT